MFSRSRLVSAFRDSWSMMNCPLRFASIALLRFFLSGSPSGSGLGILDSIPLLHAVFQSCASCLPEVSTTGLGFALPKLASSHLKILPGCQCLPLWAPYSGAGNGAAYPGISQDCGTIGPEVGANGCTNGLNFACGCALRFGFGVEVEGSPVPVARAAVFALILACIRLRSSSSALSSCTICVSHSVLYR